MAQDAATLEQSVLEAAALIRQQGDDHLAASLDVLAVGMLLGMGRFADVDATMGAALERYRASGPPTLLHMALQTLGYSATLQGRTDEAAERFEASTRVDLPEGTLSADKLIESRAAFRRGDEIEAFTVLRAYIAEVLETDNVVAASVVAIELALPALAATGQSGRSASRPSDALIDDREALRFMRSVLDDLVRPH